MDPILELSQVWAAYPGGRGAALRGASLRLFPSELGLLLGPNGAGKTTILEVFLGFLPYRGKARVEGLEVSQHRREIRKKLGYLPQALFFSADTPCHTLDLVLMGRFGLFRPWQRFPRAELDRAFSVLARLGLAEKADWPVGQLSGGQQRKALLARALVKGAKILLLDEPFASLDPEARADLAHSILQLRAEGMTVLAVIHEEEILSHADRAWFVREGTTQEISWPFDRLSEIWLSLCGR